MRILGFVERVEYRLNKKNKKNGRYICAHCGKSVEENNQLSIYCCSCDNKRRNIESLRSLLLDNFDDVCNAFSIALKNLPSDSPQFRKDMRKLYKKISKYIGKI